MRCANPREEQKRFLETFLAQLSSERGVKCLTILEEDSQALLDEKVGVENDESEGQRKDVVAGSFLEEIPDCFL